ncbi:MAG TPA: insulinase family protein [Candidatus Dormibacteraeota bacterium]|nr:insulinase family protein [Candidatus Dormibacteraeota bacterium]
MARATAAHVDTIGGYRVVRREPLERLEGEYIELEHSRTGARHIHIECADDNNAFTVFFPTTPRDSTGVAHILEHVVLAGSRRFPVRDPFFSMTRRSLSTFMNAFTSADATIYPFSTRNAKDYMNLLDVYLDATFFPTIAEDSFKQEGIRYEFEVADDPTSGLRYKGIVFNEMKGALASASAAMQHAIGKALFPDLTYSFISGGDPEHIPDLTWQRLRDFHATHYHPSNARFYTYGNLPLERTLEAIEERVLSQFERIKVDTDIPDVARFTESRALTEPYPAPPGDDLTRKSQALVGWVTVKSADSFRLLSMRVLSEVLLGHAGAPLRKALIDSKLGTAMADGTGLQDDYKQSVFGAGLKDIDEADARKVEQLVLETLEDVADKGVDPSRVDGVIHRLEFEKRERSNAGFPYALKLMFAILAPANYGGDTYSALNFDADLARLERERAEGRWFENLIRAELLDNPHRALISVVPDRELEERKRKKEMERLAVVESSLGEAERKRIVDDALRLKRDQEAKQDLSSLPTLELSDIPMKFDAVESRTVDLGGATAEFYPMPTNGVTYLDIRTDFAGLEPGLQALLPVFSRALTQSGAAGQSYVDIAQRMAEDTGGIGAAAQVQSLAAREDFLESFLVSGKALDRKVDPFMALLTDLITSLDIEPARLKEIIAESATRLESSIANLGFQFAVLLAQAKLGSEGALNERLQGIDMLHTVRDLAKLDEAELAGVIDKLQRIRTALFRQGALQFVVTCEESMVETLTGHLRAFVAKLPPPATAAAAPRPDALNPAPEARTAPVPVAFNVRTFKTVRYTHPDAPVLLVLANYLRDNYIHRELREKGGAYGGYVNASTGAGVLYFGSYRDPNIVRTYSVFDEAARWIADTPVEAEPLKEAILGACGDVDPLESPDIKGRREAANRLTGFTREERERFKQRMLATTGDDLQRVARTYLLEGRSAQATVAGAELVEAARRESPELFAVVAPV